MKKKLRVVAIISQTQNQELQKNYANRRMYRKSPMRGSNPQPWDCELVRVSRSTDWANRANNQMLDAVEKRLRYFTLSTNDIESAWKIAPQRPVWMLHRLLRVNKGLQQEGMCKPFELINKKKNYFFFFCKTKIIWGNFFSLNQHLLCSFHASHSVNTITSPSCFSLHKTARSTTIIGHNPPQSPKR